MTGGGGIGRLDSSLKFRAVGRRGDGRGDGRGDVQLVILVVTLNITLLFSGLAPGAHRQSAFVNFTYFRRGFVLSRTAASGLTVFHSLSLWVGAPSTCNVSAQSVPETKRPLVRAAQSKGIQTRYIIT